MPNPSTDGLRLGPRHPAGVCQSTGIKRIRGEYRSARRRLVQWGRVVPHDGTWKGGRDPIAAEIALPGPLATSGIARYPVISGRFSGVSGKRGPETSID